MYVGIFFALFAVARTLPSNTAVFAIVGFNIGETFCAGIDCACVWYQFCCRVHCRAMWSKPPQMKQPVYDLTLFCLGSGCEPNELGNGVVQRGCHVLFPWFPLLYVHARSEFRAKCCWFLYIWFLNFDLPLIGVSVCTEFSNVGILSRIWCNTSSWDFWVVESRNRAQVFYVVESEVMFLTVVEDAFIVCNSVGFWASMADRRTACLYACSMLIVSISRIL